MTVFHTRQRWTAFLLVYFTKSPVTAVLPLRHLCTTFSCLVEWKNTQLYQIIWRFLLYWNFNIPTIRQMTLIESRRFNSDPHRRIFFLITSRLLRFGQHSCSANATGRRRHHGTLQGRFIRTNKLFHLNAWSWLSFKSITYSNRVTILRYFINIRFLNVFEKHTSKLNKVDVLPGENSTEIRKK